MYRRFQPIAYMTIFILIASGGIASAKDTPTPPILPSGWKWLIETVDQVLDIGQYTSMKLGADGSVHISYFDTTNKELYYAYRPLAGEWTIRVVDWGDDVGRFSSLDLNPGGIPAIAYLDATHWGLKYAVFNGLWTDWSRQTVDDQVDTYTGEDASLAFKSGGAPCISYIQTDNEKLKLACYDGYAWSYEFLNPSDYQMGETSLEIDATDHPALSYYVTYDSYYTGESGLHYHYFDGVAVRDETIDLGHEVGLYNSLALTSSGLPRIAYYDGEDHSLLYAYKETLNGAWNIRLVDNLGVVGINPSIAMTPSGWPGISYYDQTHGDLKYCTQNPDFSWVCHTVDGADGSDVGLYSALSIGSDYLPRVSYYDATHGDLKFARLVWIYSEYLPLAVKQ